MNVAGRLDARPLAAFWTLLGRRLFPSRVGWCAECGRDWGTVEPRVVSYTSTSGCFAICVECWPRLSVEARVRHMRRWHGYHPKWPLVEAATRAASGEVSEGAEAG